MSDNTKTPLPRKERERRRHREAILRAALELFSEHGLHGVSMQQIAEKAEFATGTLYNFFSNKEALIQEILARCGHRIEAILLPILQRPEAPDERIRQYISIHEHIIRENLQEIRLFYKVFQGEVRYTMDPELLMPDTRQQRDRIHTELARVLREGVDSGLFTPMDVDPVTLGLEAMLEAVAFRAVATQQLDNVAHWLREIERLLFNGITAGGGQDACE